MNRGLDKNPREANRDVGGSSRQDLPPAALDYAPPRERRSFYDVLALVMTLIYFCVVAYVQVEAAEIRHYLALPERWHMLHRYAWVPGAAGMVFAILGLTLSNNRRAICIGTIIGIVAISMWLMTPIMFS